jgi:hypothetical protein
MLKHLLSSDLLVIFALSLILLCLALLPRARDRFLIWRRGPFKRAVSEAFNDGLINSFELHDLLGRFDRIGVRAKRGRLTPKVEYAEIPSDLSEKDRAVLGALPRDLPPFTEEDEADRKRILGVGDPEGTILKVENCTFHNFDPKFIPPQIKSEQ